MYRNCSSVIKDDMITDKGYDYKNLPQPVQSSLLSKQPSGIYNELFFSCIILRSGFHGTKAAISKS